MEPEDSATSKALHWSGDPSTQDYSSTQPELDAGTQTQEALTLLRWFADRAEQREVYDFGSTLGQRIARAKALTAAQLLRSSDGQS